MPSEGAEKGSPKLKMEHQRIHIERQITQIGTPKSTDESTETDPRKKTFVERSVGKWPPKAPTHVSKRCTIKHPKIQHGCQITETGTPTSTDELTKTDPRTNIDFCQEVCRQRASEGTEKGAQRQRVVGCRYVNRWRAFDMTHCFRKREHRVRLHYSFTLGFLALFVCLHCFLILLVVCLMDSGPKLVPRAGRGTIRNPYFSAGGVFGGPLPWFWLENCRFLF